MTKRTQLARAAVVFAVALACALGAQATGDPKASRLYEDALARYHAQDLKGAIIQLKNALQIDRTLLPVQLLLGKALLESTEPAAAEVAFEEALRLGVSRAEVVLPLARAVILQGRPRAILTEPRFAVDGLPRDVRLQLTLLHAGAAAETGDTAEAERLLASARSIDPLSPDSWVAEVPIRIRAAQFDAAIAAGRRAVELAPRSVEALYQLGSVYHAQGRVKEALGYYDQALALAPTHQEALVSRAGLHLDLGQLDAASADIATVRRSTPKDPRAAYLAAVVAEQRGEREASRSALADVAALLDAVPPEFLRYKPQLLMLGGLAHASLGQTEKAKPYLEAVNRAQGNVAASKLLAKLYVQDGNVDGAVGLLETYLRARPADVQAIELLAQAHLVSDRAVRAVQVLRDGLGAIDVPALHTALGLALVRAGKPDEAVPELELAWRQDPNQTRAAAALVNLYADKGELTQAQQVAEVLVKGSPRNPGFLDLLGTVQLRQGRDDAARRAFEQASQLAPQAVPPLLNLARLDARAGRFDAAEARVQAALKLEPRNVEAWFESALLSERRGRRVEARQRLEKAADHSGPGDLRAALALVAFHLRGGEAQEALKATERLAPQSSDNLPVLLATVRAMLAAGDTTGAKSLLARATRVAEYDPDAQVEIALLQMASGNVEGAAYSVEKALSTRPHDLRASAIKVDVLLRQGLLDRADQLARQIMTQHPRRAVGASLLGSVAQARGDVPAALQALRKAYELEPSSTTVMHLYEAMVRADEAGARKLAEQWLRSRPRDTVMRRALADAQARSGQFAQARKGYEAVLAAAPEDREALNNLANVLIRLGDPGALKAAERALALYPGDPNIIDTTAWAAYKAGQRDRALQLLRDARLRAPADPEIRYHLAQALADSGRRGEALAELEPALASRQPFESRALAQALRDTLK